MRTALAGHDAAYYLVHSLDSEDFTERDRAGAQEVRGGGGGRRAGTSGVPRRSRGIRTARTVRAPAKPPRGGGDPPRKGSDHGTESWDRDRRREHQAWEILRQLVVRLPAMITPRWVQTRTQPIAIDEAVADLVGVLGRSEAIGEVFEIGGPHPLTYRSMMLATAQVMGRRRLVVPVPLLSPSLSSHWLRLITDVDLHTAHRVDQLDVERGGRPRRPDPATARSRTHALRGSGGQGTRRSSEAGVGAAASYAPS